MAAAFGFDVSPDLLEPAKPAPETRPEPEAPTEPAGNGETVRILAAAAALATNPVAEAATTKPPAAKPAVAETKPAPRPAPAADATADRLEAALLSQLQMLEETLRDRPAKLPPVAPLATPASAPRATRPEPAPPASAPERSPFAPDPIRQRSYVDLREAAPAPDPAPADDTAPWRKYLAEPAGARPVPPRRPAAARPGPRREPVPPAAVPPRVEAEERRRGIRAMSAAAVLGLGVGLGLLVLMRPFAETVPTVTAAADAPPPAITSAEARPAAVGPALATLLSDGPQMRAGPPGAAVIAEAGTPPEALVAAVVAPVPPPAAAPAPPVIRPPAGQPIQVARGSESFGPDAPLAYGPTTPTYDPAQSVLNRAETAAAEEAEPAAAAKRPASGSARGSRATISQFVNLRAKPDNGAAVVAVLAQGLSVRVIGCDYWCEIEAGGKRGYVYKKFVGR